MSHGPPLVLASASPRRRDLLAALGLRFEVIVPPSVDESPGDGEAPEGTVRRLATAKTEVVHGLRPSALILAADTLVVLDGPKGPRVLGKPEGPAGARGMLLALSGREHRVLSGVALCAPDGRVAADHAETRVRFGDLDARTIDWYVSTGEPLDKAGAYGVQGAAALLIPALHGSWSNVVGLPLEKLPGLFAAVGCDLLELLQSRPG